MRCMGTIEECSWFSLTAVRQSAYIFALNILINTLLPVGKFIPRVHFPCRNIHMPFDGHGGYINDD